MSKEVLRDARGNRLGEFERQSNGVIVLRDSNGNRRGSYDPRDNVTRDANGNRVGTGNLLTRLLPPG